MALKVYVDRMSQPSRAVLLFCKLNNLEFEEVKISLFKGEHKFPEFMEINPMGQVPAISHGDFNLFESHTILRYLSAAFPEQVADHWYPADPIERAKVDTILDWHHQHTRLGAAPFVKYTILAPIFGLALNPQAASDAEKLLESSLINIETIWLVGDAKFLLGNPKPSAADLSLVCELMELEITHEEDRKRILDHHPKILKWIENVKSALNPHFEEVHGRLYEFKQTGK